MAAATILFVDIVGYSRKSAVNENKLLQMFNAALRPHVRALFRLKPEQLLCLPTGDGVALTFLHVNGQRRWSIEAVVDIIFDLQAWARMTSKPGSQVALRIGVHVGSVEPFKDINGRPNVCGIAINLAQRVMDAARPRQVLFSEDAVREYVGKETNVWKLSAQRHKLFRIEGPFEIQVKHNEMLSIYRLLPEGVKGHGWNSEDPEVKFWLSVSPTPSSKPLVGSFSDRLSRSTDIALIQLTGARLLSSLRQGRVSLGPNLRRLWVFLPADRFCVTPAGKPDTKIIAALKRSTNEWRKFAAMLRKQNTNAKVEVRRFDAPPFFGASFLDWEQPGGFIHISPYIWGVEASQCPGFDIVWAGRKPLPLYKTYVSGLLDLHRQSKLLR